MADQKIPTMAEVKDQAETAREEIIDHTERMNEALRELSVRITRHNIAVLEKASSEVIFRRAQARREQESAVEALIGKVCEAWMAYYNLVGLPRDAVDLPVSKPGEFTRNISVPDIGR